MVNYNHTNHAYYCVNVIAYIMALKVGGNLSMGIKSHYTGLETCPTYISEVTPESVLYSQPLNQ